MLFLKKNISNKSLCVLKLTRCSLSYFKSYKISFPFKTPKLYTLDVSGPDLWVSWCQSCAVPVDTHTLLLTDLRPALALPVLWMIVVCLVTWIHQLGTLNISNWCLKSSGMKIIYLHCKSTPMTFLSIVLAFVSESVTFACWTFNWCLLSRTACK